MRLKVGVAASVAANVLARPELVTIYKKNKKKFKRSIKSGPSYSSYFIYLYSSKIMAKGHIEQQCRSNSLYYQKETLLDNKPTFQMA